MFVRLWGVFTCEGGRGEWMDGKVSASLSSVVSTAIPGSISSSREPSITEVTPECHQIGPEVGLLGSNY